MRRPGDALILTKPIGVGIYSAAIKKGALPPAGYAGDDRARRRRSTGSAPSSAQDKDVHAITDVTGFGLLGHALEMARGSKRRARDPRPATSRCCTEAATLAQQGFVTGASHRNWASYGECVVLPADMPEWKRHLLTDPQTSGGLLVACAAEHGAVDPANDQGRRFPCGADHRQDRSRQARRSRSSDARATGAIRFLDRELFRSLAS